MRSRVWRGVIEKLVLRITYGPIAQVAFKMLLESLTIKSQSLIKGALTIEKQVTISLPLALLDEIDTAISGKQLALDDFIEKAIYRYFAKENPRRGIAGF